MDKSFDQTHDKPVSNLPTDFQSGDDALVKQMVEAGVHYGRKKAVTHSTMRKFLIPVAAHNEIFDLSKTKSALEEAINVLDKALSAGKQILFVGTKPAAYHVVKDIAMTFKQPYVVERWIGGLLTNFETIRTRIAYMQDLRKKRDTKEIEKYPVKERLKLLRLLEKLEKTYGGIESLTGLPQMAFIVDLRYTQHRTGYRESVRTKIPIIAVAGSDNQINHVEVVIPANDKAPRSIKFIVEYIKQELLERRAQAAPVTPPEAPKPQ